MSQLPTQQNQGNFKNLLAQLKQEETKQSSVPKQQPTNDNEIQLVSSINRLFKQGNV